MKCIDPILNTFSVSTRFKNKLMQVCPSSRSCTFFVFINKSAAHVLQKAEYNFKRLAQCIARGEIFKIARCSFFFDETIETAVRKLLTCMSCITLLCSPALPTF